MGEVIGAFTGAICALGFLSLIARLAMAMAWREFIQLADERI